MVFIGVKNFPPLCVSIDFSTSDTSSRSRTSRGWRRLLWVIICRHDWLGPLGGHWSTKHSLTAPFPFLGPVGPRAAQPAQPPQALCSRPHESSQKSKATFISPHWITGGWERVTECKCVFSFLCSIVSRLSVCPCILSCENDNSRMRQGIFSILVEMF